MLVWTNTVNMSLRHGIHVIKIFRCYVYGHNLIVFYPIFMTRYERFIIFTRNTVSSNEALTAESFHRHLDTGFSWFPFVYKRMLRWFPSFQVATTCLSCSPPDFSFLVTFFFFPYLCTCKITTATG
jgi:hypothetical protein